MDLKRCNLMKLTQGGHKPGRPGIRRDFCEHGKLRESVQPQGKINKQSIFSSSSKYLCKTAVDWVNRISRIWGSSNPAQQMSAVWWWPVILLELMWNDSWWRSLLHLLFVAITCGKVSLWLWKSLENSGNFFLLLCGHPVTGIIGNMVGNNPCNFGEGPQ